MGVLKFLLNSFLLMIPLLFSAATAAGQDDATSQPWYIAPEHGPLVGIQEGEYSGPKDLLPGALQIKGTLRSVEGKAFEMAWKSRWGEYILRATLEEPGEPASSQWRPRDLVWSRKIQPTDLKSAVEKDFVLTGTILKVLEPGKQFEALIDFQDERERALLEIVDAADEKPEPDVRNLRYGPHYRHAMDVYYPEDKGDEPLHAVVYYHGGGWWFNDKVDGNPEWSKTFTDAGLAFIAVNYRFVGQAHDHPAVTPPVAAPMGDGARALQFIRSRAGDLGIDPDQIGLTGDSAGACLALWLALHDEMADPASADPVARMSTRVRCAGVSIAQTTLDPAELLVSVPDITYGAHAFYSKFPDDLPNNKRLSHALEQRAEILDWIQEFSPAAHVSQDDPPIYLDYGQIPATLPSNDNFHATHHPLLGQFLLEKLRDAGVPAWLKAGGIKEGPPGKEGFPANYRTFLIDQLTKADAGLPQ